MASEGQRRDHRGKRDNPARHAPDPPDTSASAAHDDPARAALLDGVASLSGKRSWAMR
ncbi:MAG: hypothetical protein ACR2HD_09260 [Solirubrobacteraceae bacterium]